MGWEGIEANKLGVQMRLPQGIEIAREKLKNGADRLTDTVLYCFFSHAECNINFL